MLVAQWHYFSDGLKCLGTSSTAIHIHKISQSPKRVTDISKNRACSITGCVLSTWDTILGSLAIDDKSRPEIRLAIARYIEQSQLGLTEGMYLAALKGSSSINF